MNVAKIFNNERKFLNNIVFTILIGVVIHFLNYIFNIYLARNLDNTDFGTYNAALGIIYFIQIPVIAIQTAITKKVAQNRNFDLRQFKIRSTIQLGVVAIILTLLFILFGDYVASVANIPDKYIIPLAAAVFGAILTPIAKGFLLGLEKIITVNIVLLLETILKFAMGYLAITYTLDLTLPILANVIPAFISLIVILPLINTSSIKIPTQKLQIEYKSVLLIFITFLLLNSPFTIDLILVNPEVRASYGALSLVGKMVYFASITIASVMISKLANEADALRKRTIIISLIISALTGLFITTIFYFYSETIVSIMFKGMYLEIVPYVVMYGIAMTGYALAFMVISSLLVKDSYFHIYFLLVLTILQILLFSYNNNTLQDAFNNQMVIYSTLTVFMLVTLSYYVIKNGKTNKKEIIYGSQRI
jgi:O-antigen/teichoic acid export membrane protein